MATVMVTLARFPALFQRKMGVLNTSVAAACHVGGHGFKSRRSRLWSPVRYRVAEPDALSGPAP